MQATTTYPSSRRAPRGNTIVLVTAILVLLVIIATAFVSRTRAVRQTSAAQQAAAGRDGRAESIGVNVAQEIASALFVKPVDTADPFTITDNSVTPPVIVASSNWPRLPSPLGTRRYSVDPLDVLPGLNPADPNDRGPGDGLPDIGYNFAPYEVKPWTNWPDLFTGATNPWPFGPGAPAGRVSDQAGRPLSDANPYGNPGFGDTRWLRSTEPERIGIDQSGDGVPENFSFSHWTHLTWLPTANNGWRVVPDISDIERSVRALADPLGTPYEQWLPSTPVAGFESPADFFALRDNWFTNYATAYADPTSAMPNFISLRQYGRPTDEFRPNNLRNAVSRTLTDSDGDGFTDSFWFVAPVSTERSIRTLVGVSIVDNSALLNANIATKFSFDNTTGATPSDLTLVSSVAELQSNGATVGFFDGPLNQPSTDLASIPATDQIPSPLPSYWPGTPGIAFPGGWPRFNRSRYGDIPPSTTPVSYLQAIGVRTPTGGVDSGAPGFPLVDQTLPPELPRGAFESPAERLAWFKLVGSDPEQPRFGITPFDAADEFELRAYHGNNIGGSMSRFEQAVNLFSPRWSGDDANSFQFLRSSVQREESDEFLDQLNARQLLVDNRRKLTMFNGARNETMPPSLWLTPLYDESTNYLFPVDGDIPPSGSPEFDQFQELNAREWERQKQKIDLRRPTYVDDIGNPQIQRNPYAAFLWRRDLQRVLEKSLTYRGFDLAGNAIYQSYYGPGQNNYNRTRSMIASWVANIECATDEPRTLTNNNGVATGFATDPPLFTNIAAPPGSEGQYLPPLVDAVVDPLNPSRFYLGMEKQPFILEVFFGLVYPKSDFNELAWPGADPPPGEEELPPDVNDGGENFVDSSSRPTAIIAVQIANPYDTPVALGDFSLQFYGKDFNFALGGLASGYGLNPILPAATLGKPSTAIVYAALGGPTPFGGFPTAEAFRAAVLDFFDIERGEWQGSSIVQSDADNDGQIEYITLYDSQGQLTDSEPADPLDRTLVFDATAKWIVNDVRSPFEPPAAGPPAEPDSPNARNPRYLNALAQPVVLKRRVARPVEIGAGPQTAEFVVDRFENEETGPKVKFAESVRRLFEDPQFAPPRQKYNWDSQVERRYISGIRIRDNDFYMTWCRASRIWAWDVDSWNDPLVNPDEKRISATERSPRYVFSIATAPVLPERQYPGVDDLGNRRDGASSYNGNCWKIGVDPDGDQFGQGRWAEFTFMDVFGRQLRGKPIFFSNQVVTTPSGFEVISTLSPGTSMPFLPKLDLPPGEAAVFPQDCRGAVSLNGQNYQWHTGDKGAKPSDWNRFNQILRLKLPFQMTQKDADFEQIGEILDVFLWGHVFETWPSATAPSPPPPNPATKTVRTFSEILAVDQQDITEDEYYIPGEGLLLNRLWVRAPGDASETDTGSWVNNSRFDPESSTNPPQPFPGHQAWAPTLPLGVNFLDALTIDGPGRNTFDRNANGAIDPAELQLAEQRSFRLANSFSGRSTPGLVNLNTALPETMQALPMLTRLPKTSSGFGPYSHFVDAIRSYRDRWSFQGAGFAGAPTPFDPGLAPAYFDRGLTPAQATSAGIGSSLPAGLPRFFPTMRGERGFASIGELTLLNRASDPSLAPGLAASYSSRWLAYDPYADFQDGGFGEYTLGYSWSTDRTNPRPRQLPPDIFTAITPPQQLNVPFKEHEEPLGDAEDMSLLFKGISNLVTTRSDVFTVYLKVRQVKQNDQTGVWDGTNRELIVDDARYVMGVDRSNCNSPDDQPKILYFQKCP